MTEDDKNFRGFDPNRDMPADPLGDVHPMAEELMRLSEKHGVIVFVPTRSYSDSWVRELWEREGVLLTESPPCAFSAAETIMLLGGEEHQVNDLQIVVEKSRWPDRLDYVPENLELTGTIEIKTVVTAAEMREAMKDPFISLPREDKHRYGPHATDPYAPGARRRRR